MNSLDSRHLGIGDSYSQKFTTAGKISFQVGVGGAAFGTDIFAFNVTGQANTEPVSWVIEIGFDGSHFTATNVPTNIALGDFVIWHGPDAKTPKFSITSTDNSTQAFDSTALSENAVYVHRFGRVGTIAWTDSHLRKIVGKVTVNMPSLSTLRQRRHYNSMLETGNLVQIDGTAVDKPDVSIVVGQAVFFAVKQANGISIVDQALLPTTSPGHG